MRRHWVVSVVALCLPLAMAQSPVVTGAARALGVSSSAPDPPVGHGDVASVGSPPGVRRINAASPVEGSGPARAGGPGKQAAVAILDTGIARIPELNVVGGYDCSGSGNSSDANGHGTHVAGIVAARRLSGRIGGVVGVSPGTPLYSVRVFDASGSGDLSNVVCGVNWVVDHAAAYNIKVLNMSLGDTGSDDGPCDRTEDPFHVAVCRVIAAGVTVVAAAGNESESLARSVPGAFDGVLTVTAMADFDGRPGGLALKAGCRSDDKDDTAADFSDYADPWSPQVTHTVAAPGVCITSTWNDGGTETLSGTSMAAPHVTGLIARCIDAGPCAGMTPAQIIAKIRDDAAARPASEGFMGDTHRPVQGRFYGNLVDGRNY